MSTKIMILKQPSNMSSQKIGVVLDIDVTLLWLAEDAIQYVVMILIDQSKRF